ncbi:MAG: type II secretion system protein [Verrucomicrobiota bacterium]
MKAPNKKAFTVIELLTVIAVIAVIGAILIPIVGRSRDSANQAKSVANLRQIGLAIQSYVNDNGGKYPEAWHYGDKGKPWCRAIEPYVGMESDGTKPNNLFRCPALEEDQHHGWSDYGYNENLGVGKPDDRGVSASAANILEPSKTVLVGDAANLETGQGAWVYQALQYARGWQTTNNVPHFRHNGMANFVFLDNHAESLTQEEVELRREEMFGTDRFYGPGIGF